MDGQTLLSSAIRFHREGAIKHAIPLYREALKIDPGLAEGWLYLGMALQQDNDLDASETAYARAVSLLPDDADALNGLGTVQLALGKTAQARQSHTRALDIDPDNGAALDGLGNTHLASGDTGQAIDAFKRSLGRLPDSPETLNNLGVALKQAGRPVEAVRTLERALVLNPDSPDTLYNLGNAWQMRGDMTRARDAFSQARSMAPDAVAPRWGECFSHLDMLYTAQADISDARLAYETALAALDDFLTLDTPEQIREAAVMVGANQPFYLTYQGRNDRELQHRYGRMVHRIMTAAYPQFATPEFPERTRDRIRVGIATGFMHEHSVWKIPTRGWVRHLDRQRFEVFGYYTGTKDDHCTDEARSLFDTLRHEPVRFERLCQAIIDDELDILIYPDIGMDPTCAKLAGLRLAPVQAVSLGHPMTTGLPTMDCFLSSELMEPEDGDRAYTEQLIRLPNLSVHYEPLRIGPPRFDRAHFGLPEDTLLYLCPQSLYKYLPQYDALYPRIAREVDCRFIFLRNVNADRLNQRFSERLAAAFAAHGMHMDDHVIMLPYQGVDEYHALNCVCDVFLDSIEWSGFNTAMEAASAGLPAISMPTGHMRGRHTRAVLTRLGCTEAMADSLDAYVDLAVLAGTDREFRLALKEKTERNRAALFGDMETIRGLEDAIADRVR